MQYVLSMHLKYAALFVLLAMALTSRTDAAGEWPENYIVHKQSESPDGHYGILVLSQQAAIDQDAIDGNITYLADLKTRKTLGEIRETDYFENQNHRDLDVAWTPDSSTCVLQYDGRYGFDSVVVLELSGDSFRQIDIGKHIQKTLGRLFDGYVNAYFRFGPDRKLKVRALSYTNPKALPDQITDYALFQGVFDLKAGKWTQSSARRTKEFDALQTAYQDHYAEHMIVAANSADVPEDFTGSLFSSEQQKFDDLDRIMNDVYQAVRAIIPADRFSKVKQEQIAWLKTRDAAPSVEQKSKLTESRINTLQDLLW